MGTKLVLLCGGLVLGLAAGAAWAAEQKEATATKGLPPQIEAAQSFLLAWGRGKWDEAKALAAEKVTVKLGDKEFTLDWAGGKPPVTLVLPFKGLSTVREGGKVKSVTVDKLRLKAGDLEKEGKGTLTMGEKEGTFRVTGVTVE